MTKVLVIDDDDIARELLVSVLRDGGYETFELPSPIGATHTIFRMGIDVLVLDLLMPTLSGDKLAKMLRSNPRLKNLAIVLVSSCDPDALRDLASSVRAGAVSKRDIRTHLLPLVQRLRPAKATESPGDSTP